MVCVIKRLFFRNKLLQNKEKSGKLKYHDIINVSNNKSYSDEVNLT